MGNGEQQLASQHLIAVIDDDQSVRAALTNLLHSAGYKALSFAAAETFLVSDCLNTASCAIIDVSLKAMSGFELKEYLIRQGHRMPVIFISGNSSRAAMERALQLGARAFLEKPIKADILLTQIRRATFASGEQD